MKTAILMDIFSVTICLFQLQAVLSAKLDLQRGRTTGARLPGLSLQYGYQNLGGEGPCRKSVVAKVNFAKAPCRIANGLACGHRTPRLKVEVNLHRHGPRKGWLVNIGDSISNDGYGGDAGHNDNAPEIQAVVGATTYDVTSYKRGGAVCQYAKKAFTDHYIINPTVGTVTFYVSDRTYRITNDRGFDATHCSECLFALDGQPDTKGGAYRANKDIYLSFNKVINRVSRNGYGVCSVNLSWECDP